MRRAIKWGIIIGLIAAYAYIVGSWWIEGSKRFDQNMREHCASLQPTDPKPNGCKEL